MNYNEGKKEGTMGMDEIGVNENGMIKKAGRREADRRRKCGQIKVKCNEKNPMFVRGQEAASRITPITLFSFTFFFKFSCSLPAQLPRFDRLVKLDLG